MLRFDRVLKIIYELKVSPDCFPIVMTIVMTLACKLVECTDTSSTPHLCTHSLHKHRPVTGMVLLGTVSGCGVGTSLELGLQAIRMECDAESYESCWVCWWTESPGIGTHLTFCLVASHSPSGRRHPLLAGTTTPFFCIAQL